MIPSRHSLRSSIRALAAIAALAPLAGAACGRRSGGGFAGGHCLATLVQDHLFEQARAEHRFVPARPGSAGWCPLVPRDGRYHVRGSRGDRAHPRRNISRCMWIQDSRPDLANRYEDYGWPATIVFKADGSEIVKRQGYLPPKPMAALLQAIIDDPSPGPSVRPEPVIIAAPSRGALRTEQRGRCARPSLDRYDAERGGWGDVHKYLDWNALEYCLSEGAAGDARMEAMARQTLTARLQLIDPV